jgi:hypothetical protein
MDVVSIVPGEWEEQKQGEATPRAVYTLTPGGRFKARMDTSTFRRWVSAAWGGHERAGRWKLVTAGSKRRWKIGRPDRHQLHLHIHNIHGDIGGSILSAVGLGNVKRLSMAAQRLGGPHLCYEVKSAKRNRLDMLLHEWVPTERGGYYVEHNVKWRRI